ncbi:NAD(+) diphosphatase [Alphaproteobacteria bacterium]|nr:NAD(+) diphosphatase [Alphaproteobacteria bacterium]
MKKSIKNNTFSANPLDRAGNLRRNNNWIKSMASNKDAKFLPFFQLKPAIKHNNDRIELAWLKRDKAKNFGLRIANSIFLGLDHHKNPLFAFPTKIRLKISEINKKNIFFDELRDIAALISNENASILAQARSMINWNQQNSFCSNCGSTTKIKEGGYVKTCSKKDCQIDHFPRTDPVVIMLVYYKNFCLLGRQTYFPKNLFSVLAGFMEPGESIEEAVAREVIEETAIKVKNVQYHSSQPWPYPSSLMIGCMAEAVNKKIIIDKKEINEAIWVSKKEIKSLLNKKDTISRNRVLIKLPPPMAIAHQLLKSWSN